MKEKEKKTECPVCGSELVKIHKHGDTSVTTHVCVEGHCALLTVMLMERGWSE